MSNHRRIRPQSLYALAAMFLLLGGLLLLAGGLLPGWVVALVLAGATIASLEAVHQARKAGAR